MGADAYGMECCVARLGWLLAVPVAGRDVACAGMPAGACTVWWMYASPQGGGLHRRSDRNRYPLVMCWGHRRTAAAATTRRKAHAFIPSAGNSGVTKQQVHPSPANSGVQSIAVSVAPQLHLPPTWASALAHGGFQWIFPEAQIVAHAGRAAVSSRLQCSTNPISASARRHTPCCTEPCAQLQHARITDVRLIWYRLALAPPLLRIFPPDGPSDPGPCRQSAVSAIHRGRGPPVVCRDDDTIATSDGLIITYRASRPPASAGPRSTARTGRLDW